MVTVIVVDCIYPERKVQTKKLNGLEGRGSCFDRDVFHSGGKENGDGGFRFLAAYSSERRMLRAPYASRRVVPSVLSHRDRSTEKLTPSVTLKVSRAINTPHAKLTFP